MRNRLLRLVARQEGYTMIELLQVTVILGVVLSAVTALFVQATNAELDMSRRFQAQQEARVAIDRMRREIHCAKQVTPAGASSSITVTLPAQCPTAGGSETAVVYDTQLVSSGLYRLRRDGVEIADHVTAENVFEYVPPSTSALGRLRVTLPINTKPSELNREWKVVSDIVLRNTTRS